MQYNAKFDFRHPQGVPEEDGTYQYILDGFVEIHKSGKVILRCDGDCAYRIEGIKNSFGGSDIENEVKAGWAQITDKFYAGRWIEDGIEFLFSVTLQGANK